MNFMRYPWDWYTTITSQMGASNYFRGYKGETLIRTVEQIVE